MTRPPSCANDSNALADAFGQRVAARLDAGLDAMPADIGERLRFAREQAVMKRAALARAVPTAQPTLVKPLHAVEASFVGGVSGNGTGGGWRGSRAALRMLVVAVAVLFGAALVGMDHQAQMDWDNDVAQIESDLLLDALPPAAYADPGFAQYLRMTSP